MNPVEAFWVFTNLAGALVTVALLFDAWQERRAYMRTPNDSARRQARTLVVTGNVRREAIRLYMQIALLVLAVPSLLRPGDVPFTFDLSTPESTAATISTVALLSLITVPVALLVNSLLDMRERHRLRLVTVEHDRDLAVDQAVQELSTLAEDKTEEIKQTIKTEVRRNSGERGPRGYRGDEGERGPRGRNS